MSKKKKLLEIVIGSVTAVVLTIGIFAMRSMATATNNVSVWDWGWNGYGQLGDGTTIDRSTPVQVEGLTDIF